MTINTDSLITFESGGVTYGKIGVSKSLNQLSINDIWDAVYCSSDNPTLCEMKPTFTGETPWVEDVISPLTFMERTTGRWNYGNQELCYKLTSGANNTAEQLYGRVVWLYTTENPRYVSHRCVKSSNASSFKLITQMNVQQFELLENDLDGGYTSWGNRPKPATFNDTNIEFMPYMNLKIFEETDTQHNGNNISASNIYPYILCKFNDKICLFYGWDFAYWLSLHTKDTINETGTGKQFYYLTTYDGTDFCFNTSMRVSAPFTTYELDQYQDYYGTDINEQHLTCYSKRTDNTSWREFQIAPANKTALNTWISRFGMYFRTDKKYKPVVVNGYVSGFTDAFTIESAIDNYTGQMQHTVPSVSPSGGGGGGGNGDELLDMESRAQFYGSGVTTYYVNVPTAKLKTALGNWDNVATGKDVLKNLISYKLFCFPTSTFTNGMLHDFVIAGTTLKDESDNVIQSAQLTQYGAVNLPSITIPKTFNDFRDYAPYTNLSMYIPLCGWFTLPPWCMGRTISGEMYINGYTGTLKCIVRADGNVVTELGGNASIDLPFAAEAVGMKAAAVLGNLINTAGSIASIANPSAGGIANVGTAVLGTVCALNANYTESKGTMGDGSNIAGLYHVYIKISRPATIDNEGNSLVTIPAEYKRQYGLPCNKSLTLTQGDGYTQILDANITGNMTAREKQMIIDGFRRGLIL